MRNLAKSLFKFALPLLNRRRLLSENLRIQIQYAIGATGLGFGLCAVGFKALHSTKGPTAVIAEAAPSNSQSQRQTLKWRKQLYLAFSSLEYDGVAYMTPSDFLRCVTAQTYRKPEQLRRVLTKSDYERIISKAPFRWRSSETLFTDMGSDGIISYEEFLLLISILSRPCAGYGLAFHVFDRNSDGSLDADEFKALYKIAGSAESSDETVTQAATSLAIHFFGINQTGTLTAKEFEEFAENLQKEVLFVEFQEAARGSINISQIEFAEALLRRTRLSDSDRKIRIDLLNDRQGYRTSINCAQFQQFFLFLRHITDLFFALRMYELSGQSISQEDFQQSVRAITGDVVPSQLLKIVFDLFDIDGDGCLSYSEFLSLFGEFEAVKRIGSSDEAQWTKFQKCVKRYMVLQK